MRTIPSSSTPMAGKECFLESLLMDTFNISKHTFIYHPSSVPHAASSFNVTLQTQEVPKKELTRTNLTSSFCCLLSSGGFELASSLTLTGLTETGV